MRISKYSFPGLKFLESPELDKSFFNCDICFSNFITPKKFSKLDLNNIYLMSKTTLNNMCLMAENIETTFNTDLFKIPFEQNYTIINPSRQIQNINISKTHNDGLTIYLTIFEPDSKEVDYFIGCFISNKNDNGVRDIDIEIFEDQLYYKGHNMDLALSKTCDNCTISNADQKTVNFFYNTHIPAQILFSLCYIMFLNFVDVETKIIGSSGKSLYIENEKVKNDTNFNIKVLDKTWYTTVINSEGFPVKGHLRLQPVGEGRKDRKLIYIEPFEKNGYKREAGILKSKGLV